MKVTHGDPRIMVLFDDQGTPLCTCVSIEARDRLIEACAKLAAAEARAAELKRERDAARQAIRYILDYSKHGVGDLATGWKEPIQSIIAAARAEGGE